VKGTIPPNKKHYEVEAEMPEPALYFVNQLQTELKKNNLTSSDTKLIVTENPNTYNTKPEQLVYTHTSPKLEKIVYYTNVKSNNHYAESLLKTVGAAKSGKQGTTANGISAVENYWKDRGIDINGLHMADGSGLSRANTITTKIQTSILSKIYRDSLMYPAFNASLPVAGKNGSMTSLCKGTFAEGNMRAKTGYINRARGYCGYVKTKSGKELAFSVLFNNYDCSPKEMKLKIEKLLVALVDL
jgi:D-alanyl-D-alanine carboxypeptidase/D-alanyl-D-alanine-endopeptidase (penicillin-binding protein 4)